MGKLGIKLLAIVMCIGSMAMIGGCSGKRNQNNYISGGITDNTDYDAPKVLESDDLVSFETEFYRNSDYVYDKGRKYIFKMSKNDKGVYTISEGEGEALKCETDEEFAKKLQQIIRDNNLMEFNGVYRKTAGLAPEYGPYWAEASYSSSEKLYFYMNGDPDAKWTFEVLDLFANELGNHGITELLPAKEESRISRFNIEYSFGDIRYYYGEVKVPVAGDGDIKMIHADTFDRTAKSDIEDNRRAVITDDYYDMIKKMVDDNNLIYFQNGEIIPFDFDLENTPVYFEFYIEYENGKIMSGYSDNPDTCEKFKDIAMQFSDFYDSYLMQNANNED